MPVKFVEIPICCFLCPSFNVNLRCKNRDLFYQPTLRVEKGTGNFGSCHAIILDVPLRVSLGYELQAKLFKKIPRYPRRNKLLWYCSVTYTGIMVWEKGHGKF